MSEVAGPVDGHPTAGFHHDHEVWLDGLAPHAPIEKCRPIGRLHNRTGEDNADAHLKRNATSGCA